MSDGTPPRGSKRFFMVGIKGTGMTALAEVLHRRGDRISGSDTEERFYTDTILAQLGIRVIESFAADQFPAGVDAVVYSAAYNPATHPQIVYARALGIPISTYPEALGELSRQTFALGVSGVHGKTTTTAMIGSVVQALGLPGSVIVGSAVSAFGGRSTFSGGEGFLVAETCEYKRHFLAFHPDVLVLTGVEADHLDYYRDLADIESAFHDYLLRLAPGGTLIYCTDDQGASRAAASAATERGDLRLIGYGITATGAYRVSDIVETPGQLSFTIGSDRCGLRIPGRHNALNAAAAMAAADLLASRYPPGAPAGGEPGAVPVGTAETGSLHGRLVTAIARFSGTRRRAEVVGEASGVLFMDDYAHHPTAIRTTLAGIRAFHPDRRIIVDFMSHTYSRTAALLEQFGAAFADADIVVLHKIYASAREQFSGSIGGIDLAEATRRHKDNVWYYEELEQARLPLAGLLQEGDLFLTMGAGNNWQLGQWLLEERRGRLIS